MVKRVIQNSIAFAAKYRRKVFFGEKRREIVRTLCDWKRLKVIEAEVDGKFVPMGEDVLKTKSSFRTLPLIPAVGIILLEEKEKQEMYRRLFKKSYCRDYLDYICVDQCGKLLRPNYVTEHFSWLIEKYGLRKVRFHDLRHTFATHALTSGVDAKTLAGILGHTNASFTLDTYTHVTPDMREAAGGIVGGFMEDLFGKELKPWQRSEKQATD